MTSPAPDPPPDNTLDHAVRLAAYKLRVVPIKPGTRHPPMNSWQHFASSDVDKVQNWYTNMYRTHGVGIVLGRQEDGRNLFAVDLDRHTPDADGYETMLDLEQAHGRLPDTVQSLTPRNGTHLLYDSGDIVVTNGNRLAQMPGIDVRGQDGQICVAPTIHDLTGTPYLWEHGHAPWEIEIARAPDWLLELVRQPVPVPVNSEASGYDRGAVRLGDDDSPLDQLRATWDWETELARHGWQLHKIDRNGDTTWTRPGKDPREGASGVLHGEVFNVFTTDASANNMWQAGVISRGGSCVSLSPGAYYAAYHHQGSLSDATRALRQAQQPTVVHQAPEDATETPTRPIAKDGATFILDENADMRARWGTTREVLWPHGEALIVAGPAGTGKTTLAGQLVAGLIGVQPEVLGYPVEPATRVLYLAMDRPNQIRRAFRRRFTEEDRQALADHLTVRPGPLPADLGKKPELLLDLACAHSCDVVIIDSAKDAAVKLSDDEVGGNFNRAIQACNAAEIDVLVLHHQRKGVGGVKPTTLEDVYGSTWITAGAGSVFLLWGEPGSELIEMSHLKQPSDPIGPFTIEHDHHRGMTVITKGFDALTYLRHSGEGGATVAEVAQAEHGAIQKPGGDKWKKTERRLRGLVRDGYAVIQGQQKVGSTARYWAVDNSLSPVDTPVDTGTYPQDVDTPWTPVDTLEETPGHTVDTPVDTLNPPHRGHFPTYLDRGEVDRGTAQPTPIGDPEFDNWTPDDDPSRKPR